MTNEWLPYMLSKFSILILIKPEARASAIPKLSAYASVGQVDNEWL